MKNVAIFGGAFDPITRGHIDIVSKVLSETLINEVWVMPCFTHNFNKVLTPFETRIKMCNTAIADLKNTLVSDFEKHHQSIGGTYDLFTQLKQIYDSARFYLIIGMDNALLIDKWYRGEAIIKEIPCIVLPRRGYTHTTDLWFNSEPHIYLDSQIMEVSSTLVRDNIHHWSKEVSCKYITENVYTLIKQKGLYEKNS